MRAWTVDADDIRVADDFDDSLLHRTPEIDAFLNLVNVLNNQNGRCSYRRDLPIYIRMIEEGKLRADPILSGAYPLEQINEVSQSAEAREILTAAIVPSLAG